MRNRDEFAGFHPLVSFLWFALTLTFSMLLLHPVCLAVSLAAAFAYSVRLNGARAVRFIDSATLAPRSVPWSGSSLPIDQQNTHG